MSNVNFFKCNKDHQKSKVFYSNVQHNRVNRYLSTKAKVFYDGLFFSCDNLIVLEKTLIKYRTKTDAGG